MERIWLGLEHPGEDNQLGHLRAGKASKLLRKLHYQSRIWYSPKKGAYFIGDDVHEVQMLDNGHWFNLDRISR